jgi:hypothetical protein
MQIKAVDHGLQITLGRCERDRGDVAVGQAKTASVIANEPEAIGKAMPEPRPGGTLPVMLKVRGPGGRAHQRQALADACHCKINPVGGPAEGDGLIARAMTRGSRLRGPLRRGSRR